MLTQFVFVYLLIDVFCMLFSLIVYSKITIDVGTEREVMAMRMCVISFVAFLVADAVWAMGTYDTWLMGKSATGIVEAFTLLLMGFVAYFWFIYAENRLGVKYTNSNAFALVAAIPIMIAVLLYITTGFTGWIFTVEDADTFVTGPLALLPDILFLAYVFLSAGHALICLAREKSSAKRREQVTLIVFAIPPVVFGILDIFWHGMPVMAISVFSSLLLVFMNAQQSRINTDSMTGLNNRRRAAQYIEDNLASLSGSSRFGVFLIDVDYFKEINDKHGHGEGDRALQLIAEGLRNTVDGHHGLAARWGGDEFLVATHLEPGVEPVQVEEALRREIDAACERNQVGYRLSVSIGYAMAARGSALNDLVTEADGRLYQQKAEHHLTLQNA